MVVTWFRGLSHEFSLQCLMAIPSETDLPCPACGSLCDDFSASIHGTQVTLEPDCQLAVEHFRRAMAEPLAADFVQGEMLGQAPPSLESALDFASKMLVSGKRPLIYGLGHLTTEDARAAVALAELVRGVVDTPHLPIHNAAAESLQTVGLSTASLGEVRHYCDLVIYWGCDPVTEMPRHLARYSVEAPSRFLAGGRPGKFLVAIDSQSTKTTAAADLAIQVPAGHQHRAILALRMLAAGREIDARSLAPLPPETIEQLRGLAERMRNCKACVVFFGERILDNSSGSEPVQALAHLAREMHRYTRFYARRMRGASDILAADQVLTWQTGYSRAIDFGPGFPQYEPSDHSAAKLIEREEVDCCLLLDSSAALALPPQVQDKLQSIPTVAIDPAGRPHWPQAWVKITTAAPGVHVGGSAYRMDEITIPLRAIAPSTLPSMHQLLEQISSRIRTHRAGIDATGKCTVE